jgi:hypothetical protein
MATSPSQSDLSVQVDTLSAQVASLQNLVYSLQNQQVNPSRGLPQVTQASVDTSIPAVSQVTILNQNPGAMGIQVSVGFTTPSGVNANQIASYNVWLQIGTNTPAVIANVQQSPCTFTISSISSAVTGIVGVQTVMKDGSQLSFSQCPTTTLNLAIVSGGVASLTQTGFSLTAATNALIGTAVTINSAGTYLVLASVQGGNHATTNATLTCNLFQNGVAVGASFTTFIGQFASVADISANIGIYLITCNAGDVLQINVKPDITATIDFYTQLATLKQFAS